MTALRASRTQRRNEVSTIRVSGWAKDSTHYWERGRPRPHRALTGAMPPPFSKPTAGSLGWVRIWAFEESRHARYTNRV